MALSFDAVGLTLGSRRVLADVCITLEPGRVTAILGPNGAGKSSLLKVAAALLPIDGQVWIDDTDVATMPAAARARAIGYLPQDAVVHWNIAARDVVALGRLPHRSAHAAPGPADHAAIAQAMAETETTHLADRAVNALSGGECARVLLARVLAGQPRWLLVDEPLASLDPSHQFDLLDRLRQVAARGAGVAMVLHDLAHAARVADDVVLIAAGRVVATGPVATTLTPDRIAAVFGVAARWIDATLVMTGRT